MILVVEAMGSRLSGSCLPGRAPSPCPRAPTPRRLSSGDRALLLLLRSGRVPSRGPGYEDEHSHQR